MYLHGRRRYLYDFIIFDPAPYLLEHTSMYVMYEKLHVTHILIAD